MKKRTPHIDIVMMRPPGPDSEFVEAEDADGQGIGSDRGLHWIPPNGDDAFWRLRVPVAAFGWAALSDLIILAMLCATGVAITWLVVR